MQEEIELGLFGVVAVATLASYLVDYEFKEAASLAYETDEELAGFYRSLLKSESRHFLDYLALAKRLSSEQEVEERLARILSRERELIQLPDCEFRFHSGVPS